MFLGRPDHVFLTKSDLSVGIIFRVLEEKKFSDAFNSY